MNHKRVLKPGLAGAIILGSLGALATFSAQAEVISLNFEGIEPNYPDNDHPFVQDFYNGGTSSKGTSGTNYGIGFSSNAQAICLNTIGNSCSNTSRGGQGDPTSARGGLFFLSGSETFMNVFAGFDIGFAFNYSAINSSGSISVYDDLNGTGNLLATLDLPTTPSGPCPGYGAGFCPFVPGSIGFAGIAKSVSFAGVANQIVFDDVTFGSLTPGPQPSPVPVPAALPLMASALAGFGLMKKKFGGKEKTAA